MRPNHPDWQADPTLMSRLMDARRGTERIIREIMMPVLRQSYDDTWTAADGADLLVAHPLAFTTRLVAEKKGLPWASTALQPISFLSVYDPPALASAPFLSRLRFLGPTFYCFLFGLARRAVRSWMTPWYQLRAEIGLPPTNENPLFEGLHSPLLVLALFSSVFAARQPDWPRQAVITGFPFFDGDAETPLPVDLEDFLRAGPPPVVFTLGSAAVLDAGRFYEQSAAAAQVVGQRAILLIGPDPRNRLASLPKGVTTFEYAPYSALFPRVAAIVHHGGIGTTAQALRSGLPMLIMPLAHDQPDNAQRLARMGIARIIPRSRYTPARAAAELRHLLDCPAYSERASEVGQRVRREDGIGTACDAIEATLK
jgi:UDP:flavonoid glycosyltransferase YjiC (YdhE family)